MRQLTIISLLILWFSINPGKAQDTAFVHWMTDTLSSRYMAGRGYLEDGSLRAANFLRSELISTELQPLGEDYFQNFNIPINTIVGDVSCSINGIKLEPGVDFVVSSCSKRLQGEFNLTTLPSSAYKSIKTLKKFFKRNKNIEFLVINPDLAIDSDVKSVLISATYEQILPVTKLLVLGNKAPGWHVSRADSPKPYWVVTLANMNLPAKLEKISLNINNEFHRSYPTQNVAAFLPGSQYPDSFIVFTAHYDHLGMMGDQVYFPGCNDNASGTAMVMDLARHFSSDSTYPAMSIAFIFFSAEETGLKGSFYSAEHPLIPLNKINSLINLDMVGSGSEGITVVNATVYPSLFNALDSLNRIGGFLPEVKSRGESANSDHHPFHEKGVPSVFIYTRGKEYTEYHTVHDKGPLPLAGYEGLFRLLTAYVKLH